MKTDDHIRPLSWASAWQVCLGPGAAAGTAWEQHSVTSTAGGQGPLLTTLLREYNWGLWPELTTYKVFSIKDESIFIK